MKFNIMGKYQELLKQAEDEINLSDIKTESGNANQFSKEEIIKAAQDFVNEFLNSVDYEMECPVCRAINCKNNDTCISCGLQL